MKQLSKLPINIIENINKSIADLAEIPKPFGCIKLNHPDELYRIRIGDYRVIYSINDNELIIEIIKIAHRKDSYKNL